MILLFVKGMGEFEVILLPVPPDEGLSALNSRMKLFKELTIKPKEQEMDALFHNKFYCFS